MTRAQMWTMSNPLRFRIFERLRTGPATASQLARALGESSGTVSYHLRMLARQGAIEEDAERGTRRERWWRRTEPVMLVQTGSDPEGRAVAAQLFTMLFDRDQDARARFVSGEVDDEWHQAAFAGNWLVALTPDDAAELSARLSELVDEYRAREGPGSADSALVSISVLPWLE